MRHRIDDEPDDPLVVVEPVDRRLRFDEAMMFAALFVEQADPQREQPAHADAGVFIKIPVASQPLVQPALRDGLGEYVTCRSAEVFSRDHSVEIDMGRKVVHLHRRMPVIQNDRRRITPP
ncbi:hypothetical protein [Burkholderia ubonensis]|uniref:hypothetical protein n=1 Tax=Burkholderia ubonensis TaxID=101571 RepID=UPI0007592200|nr:hypothetical protein [Burkholderia ubonensis]KVG76094.1 hypothetical protein WJ34_05520 [Burkholderia ubonensis]KVH21414.1 hypothetical protein WJ37_15775 [Burkholderia ubonensis]KVH47633.1 hypothetical protein WJ38_18535 [Burkholderia ubonensis]KVH83001.1 hypothetical protein WJ43_21275 [Burkholderia ubonensis]KVM30108.1 hypothetical protein WJ55_21070 [Burkholderia ubonensis]